MGGLTVDRKIRALLAERIERDATEGLGRKLAAFNPPRERIAGTGWFS